MREHAREQARGASEGVIDGPVLDVHVGVLKGFVVLGAGVTEWVFLDFFSLEIFLELLGILKFFGLLFLFLLLLVISINKLLSPQLLQLITPASTTTVALHKSNNSKFSIFFMDRVLLVVVVWTAKTKRKLRSQTPCRWANKPVEACPGFEPGIFWYQCYCALKCAEWYSWTIREYIGDRQSW
jgi:hypothetical protein